jgi:hypothetical protein
MRKPRGLRGPILPGSPVRRRRWLAVAVLLVAVLAIGEVGGVALQITHSTETLAGVEVPAQYLAHWQQVGSESGVTPAPVPRLWSGAVGAPTRLSRFATSDRIDAAVAGHLALVWVFNETVGIAAATEIEINFHVQYLVGVTTTLATITVYIETQRAALAAPLTFTVYWDSGHATGVTFVDQLEVAQVCSAVGTCP